MIIHRKTRSDVIIEDLSSLEDLIKSRVIKNFKRTTKDNSKLAEKIFNKDYSSFAEFVGFVREVFNTRFSSDLKKYGYTTKEELEEKKLDRLGPQILYKCLQKNTIFLLNTQKELDLISVKNFGCTLV